MYQVRFYPRGPVFVMPRIITLLLALLVVEMGASGVLADDDRRPNVLWIMSDDLRPQLGCYGDPVVKTPHLDAFARRALRFDRAYVQCAICSTSSRTATTPAR